MYKSMDRELWNFSSEQDSKFKRFRGGKMGVKFGVCLLYLLSFSALNCNGYSGDHYFGEDPVDAFDTNGEFYQINRIPKTSEKSLEDPFNDYTELLYFVPSWKDLDPKNSEAYRIQERSPNRKKRAISKRSADDDVRKTYDGDGLPPRHDVESVKTVEFSSSFTPRFGKKRSSPDPINTYVIINRKPGDTSSHDIIRNPTTTYFNPRNWFRSGLGGSSKKGYSKKQLNPRLGRSSDHNTVQMTAGSAFTPRLGRSSGNPIDVRLNAGNVFTPRLGRSENSREVQLTAGSAFTPRLGRSGNPREVQLTAGSAFTPRLGRSGNAKQVQLEVGSAFTPRLGRSDYSREVQLTAGSAFTPRLGRSDYSREVQLTAGSAFTPRLGRSDNPPAIRLNAGRVFTPRLDKSSEQQVQLNAGGALTPRFGRSEDVDFGHRDSEEGLASRTEGWNTMR